MPRIVHHRIQTNGKRQIVIQIGVGWESNLVRVKQIMLDRAFQVCFVIQSQIGGSAMMLHEMQVIAAVIGWHDVVCQIDVLLLDQYQM